MSHDRRRRRGVAVVGPWLPVPLDFLRSRAAAELSPHGAKLLLDVFSMLGPNASRNGNISLAPRVMAARGWSGRATLNAAVRELIEHKLLVQTRQGSRLDCSLFALTVWVLDCDLSKLDVQPGAYTIGSWTVEGTLEKQPTEDAPARWRRARKTESVAPPRYKVRAKRSATVRRRAA